ncbi:MAG: YlxR family protein [Aeromicrobium sp.]|nr:MAG: YlxR family protein [Aeromicrobium sp.]
MRTCIGCRERAAKIALVRVVAVPTGSSWELTVDESRTQLGRGAYLHPTEQCLKAAITRKAFGRALRIEGRIEAGLLHEWWAERSTPTDQRESE